MAEPLSSSGAEKLIQAGSQIVGGVAAEAAGILGGSAGELAGAASLPILIPGLRSVGNEFYRRVLAPREQVRVGGAYAVAIHEIGARLERGERPRRDGFFEYQVSPGGRSAAEETFEGLLLAVGRSHEERKVPYMGKLYAASVFDASIDHATVNYLVSVADRLSWTQYLILRTIVENRRGVLELQEKLVLPGSGPAAVQLAHQVFDLVQQALVAQQSGNDPSTFDAILGFDDLMPRYLQLGSIAQKFFELARLRDIPWADWRPIARLFGHRF